MSNYKKISLIVLALFIVGFRAVLYFWEDSPSTAQQEILEVATDIDYITGYSNTLIAFDKKGQVWAYERDSRHDRHGTMGVYRNGEQVAVYSEEDMPMLSTSPGVFTFDNQGRAWFGWIGEDGGLAVFDGTSWETYKSGSGLTDNWIITLEADSRGRVWIGIYEFGLSIFDGETWQTFNTENSGLPDNRVHDIAFDDQGRAWITTNRGGVVIFDGENWKTFNMSNSDLASDFTNQIIFDEQGRAWIDTSVDISVFDGETWLHYPIEHELDGEMFFDGMGRLWALRGMNVHVFDGSEWKYFFDPNTNLFPWLADPQGYIWMGNGYDILVSVAPEDLTGYLCSASQGRSKAFFDSGVINQLTTVLITLWVAAALSAWWTMLISMLIGLPTYLMWYWVIDSMLRANTPAEAAFFGGDYASNPGMLIAMTILIGGMLGAFIKRRSGRKRCRMVGHRHWYIEWNSYELLLSLPGAHVDGKVIQTFPKIKAGNMEEDHV